MTDLTEQWKKGELPEGHYYVKDGENMIAEYLDGYFYNDGNPMTSFSGGVDSVLDKVPSYEEYISLVNWKEDLTQLCTVKERIIEKYENIDTWWKAEYSELKEENAELKELLKECVKMNTRLENALWQWNEESKLYDENEALENKINEVLNA